MAAGPRCLSEQELAAASLGLLAQPMMWPSLRLPPVADLASVHEAPWTTYWTTRLDAAMDVLEARQRLESALAAFSERDDRVGELLCLAAIIEGFYVDEGPLDPLDHWTAELCRRLPADDGWPSIELESRIIACGVGILLRSPAHPQLAQWAARGAVLVRLVKPSAGRLKLATFLAQYHLWRGEFERTALLIDTMPGLDMTGLLPAEALVDESKDRGDPVFGARIARDDLRHAALGSNCVGQRARLCLALHIVDHDPPAGTRSLARDRCTNAAAGARYQQNPSVFACHPQPLSVSTSHGASSALPSAAEVASAGPRSGRRISGAASAEAAGNRSSLPAILP